MCGIVGDDQLLYSATATAQFYKVEYLVDDFSIRQLNIHFMFMLRTTFFPM
jgi:hypothetical protein